ncbi:hypothetical protein MANI_017516 [Metarhizium anisopliae]
MTLIENIRQVCGDVSAMIGICEGVSSEAVEEGFRLEVLRLAKNVLEKTENMVEQTAVLESQLQSYETAQAEMRREFDKLQETFNIRLQDHVKAETKEIQERIAEHMEKQFNSRFVALVQEVRRADAEASPCQMEREKRLDEKEQRLCEMEKRLTERQEELTLRETSLRETRIEVNSRMRELAAARGHSSEHVEEMLDGRFLTMQTTLEEISVIGASIQRQVNITSEVVGQISSDLSKLGGPTPPSTTEVGKPKWLHKYQSLRFWDSAIDRAMSHLAILNVVGAENMEPKEVCQLLLDTLQPDNLYLAMRLVDSGPSEYWFCFRGICNGEEIEPENDQCPIHGDCILVKRTYFDNEMGEPEIGLKFRKVRKAV